MRFSNVVLPEPLGPMRAWTEPGSTVRLTLSSARTPPKARLAPETTSGAGVDTGAHVTEGGLFVMAGTCGDSVAAVRRRRDQRRPNPAMLGAPLGNDPASQMSRIPNPRPSYCEKLDRNSGAAMTIAVTTSGPTTDRLPPITTAPKRYSDS